MQDSHVGLFDLLRTALPARRSDDPLVAGTRALERGRLGEAEPLLEAALAAAATPAAAALVRNKRAILAIRRDDAAGAVAELIAAFEAEPRTVPALVTLGNLLLETGAGDEAIVHYAYALLIAPDDPGAHHNLGVALRRAGRRGAAARMMRKATRLEGRIFRR